MLTQSLPRPRGYAPPLVSMRSLPHQARQVTKFTFLLDSSCYFSFGSRFFRRQECSLLLSLYGHGNLAIEAYVQQLKNSVNIDMRRGGLSEFKVDDPIIIRKSGQIILGNLVFCTLN